MASHNRTGRSKNPIKGRYSAIPHSVTDSRGYLAASPLARAAYIEVLRRYNGFNNGTIAISCRDLGARLNLAHTSGARALNELENLGLIRMMKASSFGQKRKAAEYRLTHLRCDVTSSPPTKEYEHFGLSSEDRQESKAKK